MTKPYIGIDLGTTYSSIAYYDVNSNTPKIIKISGRDSVPSKVFYMKDQLPLIGIEAETKAITYPKNVIYDTKRMLGTKYKKMGNFIKNWPFDVVKGENNSLLIKVDDMKLQPLEVSSHILKFLKKRAEEYFPHHPGITDVVITHPQQFNSDQIEQTKQAAILAGFENVSMINEPTAAILACTNLEKNETHHVLVYDFGGGTFDVSVAEVKKDDIYIMDTGGDSQLGGQDIDLAILRQIATKINDVDLYAKENAKLFTIAKNECKRIKESFSGNVHSSTFTLNLPGDNIFQYTMRNKEFNNIISDIIGKTIKIVKPLLDVEKMKVLLVGGSSLIPLVKTKLMEDLNLDEDSIFNSVDPLGAVANGAAIWNYKLHCKNSNASPEPEGVNLHLKLAKSLGLKVQDDHGPRICHLLKKNVDLPASITRKFANAGDDDEVIELEAFAGESFIPEECEELGTYVIPIKKQGPAKSVVFSVTFTVNEENIISCSVTPDNDENLDQTTFEIKSNSSLNDKQKEDIMENTRQQRSLEALIAQIEKLSDEAQTLLDNTRSIRDAEIRSAATNLSGLLDEIECTDAKTSEMLDQLQAMLDEFKQKCSHLNL